MYYLRMCCLTFGLGLFSLVLQGTVMKLLMGYHFVVPQLLLVLVVFLGFRSADIFGAILVFLLGLLADLAGGVLLGPWACAFVVIFSFTSAVSQRLFSDSAMTSVVISFFGSMVASVIYLFLELQFKSNEVSVFSMWDTILMEAVLTALLAPPLFWLFRSCFKITGEGTS